MPDEVDYLVTLYLNWLNGEIHSLDASLDNISPEELLVNSLSLACDAHTKMVHIHPFSDGNGRLARIIKAVGSNSIFGNSTHYAKCMLMLYFDLWIP